MAALHHSLTTSVSTAFTTTTATTGKNRNKDCGSIAYVHLQPEPAKTNVRLGSTTRSGLGLAGHPELQGANRHAHCQLNCIATVQSGSTTYTCASCSVTTQVPTLSTSPYDMRPSPQQWVDAKGHPVYQTGEKVAYPLTNMHYISKPRLGTHCTKMRWITRRIGQHVRSSWPRGSNKSCRRREIGNRATFTEPLTSENARSKSSSDQQSRKCRCDVSEIVALDSG